MRLKVKNVAVLTIAFLTLSSLVFVMHISGAIAEEAGAAQVPNHSSYIKYESYREIFSGITYQGDFLHVVGEVQNVIGENIKIVTITLIFYDGNGAVIEAEPIHTSLSPLDILTPGQKSPFEKILLDAAASRKVAHYEFLVKSIITTEEPPMLEIPNHSSHGTRIDTFEVVCEVKNIGVENIDGVRIFATFYDEQGTVIGANSLPSGTGVLVPGQKSPFSIYNYGREEITEKIQSYGLCAEGRITAKEPYRELQIITHNSEIDRWHGYYEVRGEVKNVGETDATSVSVVATFYDSDGRIVDSDFSFTNASDLNMTDYDNSHAEFLMRTRLNASQTGSFRISLLDDELSSKVTSYTLQVQCREASYIQLSNLEIVPSEAEAGEEITIMVNATNHGDVSGTKTVTLTINGVVESTKDVTLSSEETRNVTFTVTKQEDGTYIVKVPGIEDKFIVNSSLPPESTTPTEPEPEEPSAAEESLLPFNLPIEILLVIVAVVAVVVVALVAYKLGKQNAR